jgi:hypothetical protein
LYQSVRITTHSPALMAPWLASQPFFWSSVRMKIVVLGRLYRAIDDVDRPDEFLCRDGVGGAVGIILAGDPVDRRVEMRAGMLAEFQPVPGPERPVLVIGGDRMNLDLGRIDGQFRRQFDQRRLGPEHGRKVDHLDAAGKELAGDFAE